MISCRACSLATNDFVSIYSRRDNTTLADMLTTLVPVDIPHPSDDVLTVMCADCVTQMAAAYQFVQVVLQADKAWKEDLQCDTNSADHCKSAPEVGSLTNVPTVVNAEHNGDYDDAEYLMNEDEVCEELEESSLTDSVIDRVSEPVAASATPTEGLLLHVEYIPTLVNGEETFRCCGRKCYLTFQSRQALEEHGAAIHGVHQREFCWEDSYKYECTVCFTRFQNLKNLMGHLRRAVRKYQCSICEVCFKKPNEKYIHMKQRHGGLIRKVKSHQLERQQIKIYCGCGERFGTEDELLAHGRKVHQAALVLREDQEDTDEPTKVRCNVCYKSYKNVFSLQHHRRMAYLAKPFACKQCGNTFQFKSRLEAHQLVHVKERNFVCEMCDASFTTKVGLVGHLATHRDRLFRCSECDFRASKQSRLKEHMKRHSDLMPFACKLCPKRCRSKQNLYSHLQSHKGDKPHQCRYCDLRYAYASDRAKHEFTHTGNWPYACGDCDKKFSRPGLLKAHVRVCRKPEISMTAAA